MTTIPTHTSETSPEAKDLLNARRVFGFQEKGEPIVLAGFRAVFSSPLIGNCGFDQESAKAATSSGGADMIVIGRPFIANPDLVEGYRNGWPLAESGPRHGTRLRRSRLPTPTSRPTNRVMSERCNSSLLPRLTSGLDWFVEHCQTQRTPSDNGARSTPGALSGPSTPRGS